jgi:hypothetical protein
MDAEVEADIEVSGSVAPGSPIVVYFSCAACFLHAIQAVADDRDLDPLVPSTGWGMPEGSKSLQGGIMQTMRSATRHSASVSLGLRAAWLPILPLIVRFRPTSCLADCEADSSC